MVGLPLERRRRYKDAIAILLVLSGLYWFAASFFLAKRSLVQTSDCDGAELLLREQLGLTDQEIAILKRQKILSGTATIRQGCWMERRVDSMIILLVDALRFDFAYYNLPLSIGKRLAQNNASRLFQFIADPPTVTMQRLKALTTGGLPTFADISANFGGATVPDDSWVKQLLETSFHSRGLSSTAKLGFVGDDTWEDLFPNYFAESHPYPSFNTRDLDTVDNGCLKHLPSLVQRLRRLTTAGAASDPELEVAVVHFLGVDHVGHTYGPHNAHMDAKLREMDAALQTVLEVLDASEGCHAALIFGDHGMTNDGNHGGGTPEETHAALFVHASPACGDMSNSAYLEQQTESEWVSQTFASIHQIDLVPVIAIMLGLPIPFANLGGLVPSLLPGQDIQQMTAALALNAAQVFRYFTIYSATANRLPNIPALRDRLQLAVGAYQEALQQSDDASEANDDQYVQAATLFKTFLTEALALGQRVWTRFYDVGMISGIAVLAIGIILYALPLVSWNQKQAHRLALSQYWELITTMVFIIYLCGMLTFSNSYILEEENCIMYCLGVLSVIVALRLQSDPSVPSNTLWRNVALLPLASRLDELLVSGHGLDPSIRLHSAHTAPVFLTSLAVLGTFRWYLYRKGVTQSMAHAIADCVALACFGGSWWEKRDIDPERNGYWLSRVALALLMGGIPFSIVQALTRPRDPKIDTLSTTGQRLTGDVITILAKVLINIMAVTGPSAATSLVFFTFQAVVVYCLAAITGGPLQVHSLVVAALWRLITRHAFFATNHGCFFNRLQYSAAFIATQEFYVVTGGISLFLNTFGWEMVGIVFAWLMSQQTGRSQIWRAYGVYQLIEALTSCISVSVLRRHLMVWDIYAPHFLFVAIFTVLCSLSQLTVLLLSELS
jgi:phosphatidylinositol glycan class O